MDCDALEKESARRIAEKTKTPSEYSAHEWGDWADKRSEELEEQRKAMQDLEAEVNWRGKA